MSVITAFSLDRSRLTITVLVAIVLVGLSVFLDYPKREDPSIVVARQVEEKLRALRRAPK